MSYYNQIANQAQGFSNYSDTMAQRGQDRINDYNIEKGEYNGAEVAHRSGLQALQTGNEMPRLIEEYFGLKPAAKKIVPALLEKTGITGKFNEAIKGTKLEGYLNRAKTATENVKAAAKAVKEGDYGKAADAMTGGKASEAAASVKKFAEDTLAHHTAAAKDALTEGAGEAKNTLDRFVGKAGSQVRQIGSDAYKSLSADAKAALPKGAIDEHGIPLNPSEITRADTYKGLTTGRMKLGKDGTSIEDTLTGAGAKPGVGAEGLPGGGRLTQEGGQFSFKTEGGEPYGAGASSDGSMRMGSSSAYEAQKEASLGRDFQGSAQTQETLNKMTAAKDAERGSVDFGERAGRVVDPAQLSERAAGKRAIKAPDATPERASAEDVAQARIPKITTRPGQKVRVRGDPATEGEAAPPPVATTTEAPPSGIKERIQQKIRENQSAKEGGNAPQSATEAEQAAARSTTTEGGYADQLAPMREAQARQAEAGQGTPRSGAEAAESDAGKGGEEAGSFIERAGATIAKEASPLGSAIEGVEGAVAKARMTDSGISNTTATTQASYKTTATDVGGESLGKEEAVKGAETFGKTVAETEGELAPVDAAEAALPGVGEVLMGLTAIGGLVRGAIKEHKEKKAMEADTPVAPATVAQQAQGEQKSGIAFSSAPVIDSSDYHHL
jgi:hypothetical protein